MLTLQAAESTYITTKALDEKNIALVAKPGSLLATLVAATYINFDPAQQGGEYHHDLGAMCALTDQASNATGYSEHTARMEETSDFLAEKLQKHLFYARTVVAPFVDAYAGRLTQAMELIGGNPDNGVEVVMHTQPGPLSEPSLISSIQLNRDAVFTREELLSGMPELDDNQIRTFMMTGAASVDAAIAEHFAKKEEGWLAARWKEIFCRRFTDPVPSSGLDAFISGRENVDTALMVFLVTRRIWNAPLDGANMSSAAYEDAMVRYRTQSGLRLCHELERLDRDSQSGILVIGTETSPGGAVKLIVNAAVYRDFLTQGGTNEVLLGNLLQPQKEVRLDRLLANKDLLESTWSRHYAYNRAFYDQKRLLKMREALVCEWEYLARDYTPEDFPVQKRASSRAMILKLSHALQPKDFDDLSSLALRLACEARFYETDAYEILSGMQRARENNPGLNATEAANISVTEYVCRWIGKAMDPVAANQVQVFTAKDTQLV
ncbi:hypothetical protein [Ralstonia phage RP12]|uniref:Uncharacterized protein n=1 Tax=Ralstonia phage RP12 TaxID=1923889 RepID=A0A1L7N0M3_9CAUD|nr:hypothetical protein FDH28_gp039 [Ralstonia phage RP12]BAW19013.1 hypothetical protein [Ralstonia phage RP12]